MENESRSIQLHHALERQTSAFNVAEMSQNPYSNAADEEDVGPKKDLLRYSMKTLDKEAYLKRN